MNSPADDDATVPPGTGARTVTPFPRAGASGAIPRFAPGSIVAGRYRLVALLGRGGMGEVYRADDLTLDQPVALKFLPEGVAVDAGRLTQFHNELRIARQVSHRNVCRLYDLGDADGRRFLTMEYVDGEDLSALLRRIGRFPQERAIAIARQLCAGVAAAHERGVIHRDLKPANVMIDGDGNVRITDFGIATAAADAGADIAGTPQYMAPEQLDGAGASIRTDIYSLGLILFEIFTGRRAHDAKTLKELKAHHEGGTVTTPSSIVRDLDPVVERVILRCLERDPARRPGSALAVAAALPGGDPLADALAAGETPSPDILAAAAESDAVPVGWGLAAVAATAVGLFALTLIAPRITIVGRSPTEKAPAVLADRIHQILASFGYTDPIADTAEGLSTHQALLRWIPTVDSSARRWDRLTAGRPSALLYWQRTSPRHMVPSRGLEVSSNDPQMTVSGMTLVIVDSLGRLIEFQAVPPQFDAAPDQARAPDWTPIFDAAGLDMSAFTAVAPQWSPRDFADTRAAWEGPLGGDVPTRIRVEAAAFRGRPVSVFVLGPWSRPTRMATLPRSLSQIVLSTIFSILVASLVAAAVLIAYRNWRTRRADTRGATRLVVALTGGYAVSWLLGAHHVPDVSQEINSFWRYFGTVLMSIGVFWLVYVALEPYVRRFWPDGILGWTRLVSGYVRDPRVGRELLIGCVVVVWGAVVQALFDLLPPVFGYRTSVPWFGGDVAALESTSTAVNVVFDQIVNGLFFSMFAVLGFVLLRLLFTRTAVAVAAAAGLLAILQAQVVLGADPWWITALFQALLIAMVLVLVVRFGLLVTAVGMAIGNVLNAIPVTYKIGDWTATGSNLAVAFIAAVALFGFYASRTGQPLFGKLLSSN